MESDEKKLRLETRKKLSGLNFRRPILTTLDVPTLTSDDPFQNKRLNF